MKARELFRMLREAGAELVRTKGDHQIWKLPNGKIVSIPHGGRQTEVSSGMAAKVKNLLR